MTWINKKNRIHYVDTYKAIGILLMILLHVGVNEIIDTYVHVFHMPMFFFISGYMFNGKTDTKEFILKKIRSLIVPYLGFCMLYYFLWIIFKGFTLEPLKNIYIYNSDNIPISNGLWFLTALFFTNIIFLFVDKIKSFSIKAIMVVFISLIGTTLNQKTGILLPLSLQASFAGTGLFYSGHILREKIVLKNISSRNFKIMFAVLFLMCVLLVPISGYVTMRVNCYENPLLFYPSSICCSVFVLLMSYKLNQLKGLEKILKAINKIGEYSIIYLCLNEPIVNSIRNFIDKTTNIKCLNNLMCYIITVIIIFLICQLYSTMKRNLFKTKVEQ